MRDTIRLGDLEVKRLGFGAMRLPGKDVWGEPDDRDRAKAVLGKVVALGVSFIDTSWYYGPHTANRLIKEALAPYPKDLVIATKLGGRRHDDKSWGPFARPEQLREGCEHDLRDLGKERIDVVHFRYMKSSGVPFLESLDAMIDLQKEGKIRHLALSVVGKSELDAALKKTPIVAVQNMFNVAGGGGPFAKMTHSEVEDPEGVLAECEKREIAFLPYFPLGVGAFGQKHRALDAAAAKHGATPAQIAIAWLLARSPVILPIPGTSSPEHAEENWNARKIELSPQEVTAIATEARAGG